MARAGFLGSPKVQYFDDNGNFLAGGKLYSYKAETTTKVNTYQTISDAIAKTNPNTNPVILDSIGSASVVITGPTKLVLTDADDNVRWTVDNLGTETNNVYDVEGNLILAFDNVSNAEVWVELQNNVTGAPAIVRSGGLADSVDLQISSKGPDGKILLTSGVATFTMPVEYGGNNDYLLTNEAGVLSWGPPPAALVQYAPPTGTIHMFATSTAPTDWLNCDGAAVSRTTYATLFGVIGTTFGGGDGSTTFNVPNFSRRTAVGRGGTASSELSNSTGSTGGAETVTLTVAQMPSHNHSYTRTNLAAQAVNLGGSPIMMLTGTQATVSTGSAGSGTSHNNIQPSLVVNYIIKT